MLSGFLATCGALDIGQMLGEGLSYRKRQHGVSIGDPLVPARGSGTVPTTLDGHESPHPQ
jgi:hypothetical protein